MAPFGVSPSVHFECVMLILLSSSALDYSNVMAHSLILRALLDKFCEVTVPAKIIANALHHAGVKTSQSATGKYPKII